MAGINNVGYSTHILGTVKSVMKCLGIILYNRYEISDTKLTRISLYNINEVYDALTKSGKGEYIEVTREDTDSPFIYEYTVAKSNNLDNGFSTIIYLSPVDNTPLGYTEFRLVQGKNRDINIILNLKSSVEDLDVVLTNSLGNVENSNKNYLGKELHNYTSSSTALDSIKQKESINKNYTKFLNQAKMSNCSIYLDSGFVKKFDLTGELGFVKLNIFKNMNYSLLEYDFDKFNISFYGADIILGTWTGLNYCITSLTQKNKFGELIRYTKSNTGYFTLPPKNGIRPNKILYSAGKYIICEFEKTISSFNIETREWEEQANEIALVDPLDPSNKLYDLPNEVDLDTVYKTFPDLVNTFYDYKQEKSFRIIRKVGNWIILEVVKNSEIIYIVSGISYALTILPKQLDRLIFLDDNTLILNNSTEYCIYRGIGTQGITPEAKRLLEDETSMDAEIMRINKFSSLFTTEFNSLRRGPYPLTTSKIPEIVAAFCGHLFYIDKQNHLINIL